MIDIIFMTLGFIALILLPVFAVILIWHWFDIFVEWAKARDSK